MATQQIVNDYSKDEMIIHNNKKLKSDLNAINTVKYVTNGKYEELGLKDYNKTIIFPLNKTIYSLSVWFNISCVVPLLMDKILPENINSIYRYLASTIKEIQPNYKIANIASFKVFIYLQSNVVDSTWTNNGLVTVTALNEPINAYEYCKTFQFDQNYEISVNNSQIQPQLTNNTNFTQFQGLAQPTNQFFQQTQLANNQPSQQFTQLNNTQPTNQFTQPTNQIQPQPQLGNFQTQSFTNFQYPNTNNQNFTFGTNLFNKK